MDKASEIVPEVSKLVDRLWQMEVCMTRKDGFGFLDVSFFAKSKDAQEGLSVMSLSEYAKAAANGP